MITVQTEDGKKDIGADMLYDKDGKLFLYPVPGFGVCFLFYWS